MAFFSPAPKGKKVAPLPMVHEEPVYSVTPQTLSSDYSNRNMYRPGFTANDPKNAAAAARRAATRASMPNPNIGPRTGVVGAWAANAPAPRPTIVIPKGGSRRNRRKTHRRRNNTRRR